MLVVSTFEHSAYLELAITELEQWSIPRSSIFAVPLDRVTEKQRVLDTIHSADGISRLDGAAALSSVFMLLGTIYGFLLAWGPIIWGLIGLIIGAGLGFILDSFGGRLRKKRIPKGQPKTSSKDRVSEVVLIVQCESGQSEMVKKVLGEHFALGIGDFSSSYQRRME